MLIGNVEVRDLSDLTKDPYCPLTDDEQAHFDEYMTFKDTETISVKDVSLTDTVREILADLDYYLGFKREKSK
ncbi:MAG: hypothetical protein FWB85_02410 [Chitinispirillia bacterium]|nr:hypothetical protein [Chitinispirillia bacterium]